jgi:septum formation protein
MRRHNFCMTKTAIPALILASSSPYRKALLARLGLPFETVSPDVDEAQQPGEQVHHLVRRLALAKARAGSIGHSNALVIGSDQCAVRGAAILGKPGNYETAFAQLKAAAGKFLTFHTGLCLLNKTTGEAQLDDVVVTVRFRRLSDDQIATYLQREAPYNCAGSFMLEGLGIALIERIEGDDPNALIGLPLIKLVSMLANAGVRVI